MKMKEKKQNEINDFYHGLGRKEKRKFLLWLQIKTERSQGTVLARLKDDGWRQIERDVIMEGIANESWRNN